MSAVATRAALIGLFVAGAAQADTVVNAIAFEPLASAQFGLELEIQNFSKLPRQLAGIDVLIGGSERRAACRVTLPGLMIEPAGRARVTVANPRTLGACLPAGTVVRWSGRMANVDLPVRGTGVAALRFDRSIRIVPRFVDPRGRALPRQMLTFKLGH